MANIVFTYFEPFGGKKTNASEDVALSLVGKHDTIELSVSWDRVGNELDNILRLKPSLLIMFGEAGMIKEPRIELEAHNISRGVDNEDNKKNNDKIAKDGKDTLFTNIKISEGKFETSNNAGEYLCNYSYYLALYKSKVTKVIFIHVPIFRDEEEKEAVIQKVEEIYKDILENDNDDLIELKGNIVSINKDNAYDYYPYIQEEYDFPNILISETFEDEKTVIKARADQIKGTRYYYLEENDDKKEIIKDAYYSLCHFLIWVSRDGRLESFKERTKHFEVNEYFYLRGLYRKYTRYFIANGNYNDEISFYRTTNDLFNALMNNSELDEQNKKAIEISRDYIDRMGLEKTKEILLKII